MPVSILRVIAVFRYVKSAICRCDQQRPKTSNASECEIAGDQPTTLTLNTLGTFFFSANDIFKLFFLFFPETGFDILCKLSPDNVR